MVSVVMPVFNVEKYVAKAIESIIAQTYQDIELIVVDDGSTDNSRKICQFYAEKDNRIIFISRENKGIAATREEGFCKANGKYVMFMDSDDYLEGNAIELLVKCAESNDSQMVIFGYYMEYYEKGHSYSVKRNTPSRLYNDSDSFRKDAYIYLNKTMLNVIWNKMIRRDYIISEDIHYKDLKFEDSYYAMDIIKNIQRVCVCSECLYHWYRSREGSETYDEYTANTLFSVRLSQFQDIYTKYSYWCMTDDIYISEVYKYFLIRVFQCIQEITDNKIMSKSEKEIEIKNILADNYVQKALNSRLKCNLMMAICVYPMKWNSLSLTMVIAKIISVIKRDFGFVFNRLKGKVAA